jgi:hypothetical protein
LSETAVTRTATSSPLGSRNSTGLIVSLPDVAGSTTTARIWCGMGVFPPQPDLVKPAAKPRPGRVSGSHIESAVHLSPRSTQLYIARGRSSHRIGIEDGSVLTLYIIPILTAAGDHQDYQIGFN